MAIGELIFTGDTLDVGRMKINNFYSGNTIIWSGGVGTNSLIRGNSDGNLGNSALANSSLAAGVQNLSYGNFGMSFWGSGNTAGSNFSAIVSGRDNFNNGAYSFVGGGANNSLLLPTFSFIGGGIGNSARTNNVITIVGGQYNFASGNRSFIGGGQQNTVTGSFASIVGGASNTSSGAWSIVAGGQNNKATGQSSSVHGGAYNVAGGIRYSHVFGGKSNTATTIYSAIVGGFKNYVSGASNYSVILGGQQNITTALNSGIVGGYKNIVKSAGSKGFIAGGQRNIINTGANGSAIIGSSGSTTYSQYSIIVGGQSNKILLTSSGFSFIGGGKLSSASGRYSSIIGGSGNTIGVNSLYASIAGGKSNKIGTGGNGGQYCFIGGGSKNTITGFYIYGSSRNAIVGGTLNSIGASTNNSFIGGGVSNQAYGTNGAVIGGRNNFGTSYSVAMGGGAATSGAFQLMIGNQPTLPAGPGNNRLRLDGVLGQGVAPGGFIVGAADYAEYFEWIDGNENNENRLGYFVSLIDGKIQIGNSNVLGIVSSSPGFLGDAAELVWDGMYLKDEWNRETMETYKSYSWTKNNEHIIIFEDINGRKMIQYPNPGYPIGVDFNGVIPTSGVTTGNTISPKMNPNYATGNTYTPRSKRTEWAPIGLLGKLHVRTAEPIIGKKISVNNQGLAINGDKYDILKTIRAHSQSQYGIVKIFFK